jgi:hypothetical protein
MKIIECDRCHVQVNEYDHWKKTDRPRSMYELNRVHDEYDSDTYEGMIFCSRCVEELLRRPIDEPKDFYDSP